MTSHFCYPLSLLSFRTTHGLINQCTPRAHAIHIIINFLHPRRCLTLANVLYRPASAIMFIHRSSSIISIVSSVRNFFTPPFYFFAHTFVSFLASSTLLNTPPRPSLLHLPYLPDCLSLFSSPSYYSAFAFMSCTTWLLDATTNILCLRKFANGDTTPPSSHVIELISNVTPTVINVMMCWCSGLWQMRNVMETKQKSV